VEDAPEYVDLIVPLLHREGHAVSVAGDGAEAVEVARSIGPDLIVLDLALPGTDGLDVCRQVRAFSDAYIIMVTSRSDEVDRVVGLEIGADDYLTKPFSPRELLARVRALLRRPRTGGAATVGGGIREVGSLHIDTLARTVHVSGEEVSLTRIEFDLLDTLASNPAMVFSRALLRERVWGADWLAGDHVVDVHIANLRKKIDRGRRPGRIRTVRGVGYQLRADD
jgi:DNA-binding response OmpR family regulator